MVLCVTISAWGVVQVQSTEERLRVLATRDGGGDYGKRSDTVCRDSGAGQRVL